MKGFTQKKDAQSPTEIDANAMPGGGDTSQQETTSRRALIQKYGKYAAVGGPLLLFVSKAHAIHSRP
jgi:hypothetical protein